MPYAIIVCCADNNKHCILLRFKFLGNDVIIATVIFTHQQKGTTALLKMANQLWLAHHVSSLLAKPNVWLGLFLILQLHVTAMAQLPLTLTMRSGNSKPNLTQTGCR